jgi:lysophospholipase L1-like esterase
LRSIPKMKILLLVLTAICFFIYGLSVGHYHLFPFHEIQRVHSQLRGSGHRTRQFDIDAERRSTYYWSRVHLFRQLAGTADVVMLGDSLTEWIDWRELLPDLKVMNRGISGDTTDGVIERLDEIIGRSPRYVPLLIGVNDLFYYSIPHDVVVINSKRIVMVLKESGAIPIVISLSGVSANYPRASLLNRQVSLVNKSLQQWCKTNAIQFFDLHALLTHDGALSPENTWDGLHFTGRAYLIWRDAMRPLIR